MLFVSTKRPQDWLKSTVTVMCPARRGGVHRRQRWRGWARRGRGAFGLRPAGVCWGLRLGQVPFELFQPELKPLQLSPQAGAAGEGDCPQNAADHEHQGPEQQGANEEYIDIHDAYLTC